MTERGRSTSPRPLDGGDIDMDTSSKENAKVVIVTNLTRNVVESHLQTIFGFYGQITKIDLPLFAKSGQNRGKAALEYSDPAGAHKAASHMNGGQLDGAILKVELSDLPVRSRSRSPRPPPRNGRDRARRVLLQTDTAGRTLIAAEALGAEVEVEVEAEGTFIVVEDVVDPGHPFAEDLEEDLQATLVVDMDDVGQGRGATRFAPVALVLVLGRFLVRAPVPEQDPARGQCRILPTRDIAEAEAEAEAARDHLVEEGGVSVVKIFGIVGPVPGHLETSVIIRSFCCIRMNF
ncbi:hypothetical protein VKT23_002311 [Stygiomarasmius scandens]|uniref:RRM domain-containing protein n=1 Tax=Marasmiellus scandens TaxID=2682957 RepID=A0ABR1K1K7_9AGAR